MSTFSSLAVLHIRQRSVGRADLGTLESRMCWVRARSAGTMRGCGTWRKRTNRPAVCRTFFKLAALWVNSLDMVSGQHRRKRVEFSFARQVRTRKLGLQIAATWIFIIITVAACCFVASAESDHSPFECNDDGTRQFYVCVKFERAAR